MIEVRDLKRKFGQATILNGVNLRVEKGESVVIIGRSGGGKSVLLKHIIGLLVPDEGEVLIDGENLCGLSERELLRVRNKFGMLFQGAALFDSMTVAENVGFLLRRAKNFTEGEITRKIGAALDMVELAGSEKKKPSELSGGMRKRVGLARAIVYEPQFILYDEPTTGLDPVVSDSIDKLIIRLHACLKVTTVVVTHDMRSASRVGQRILMLHEKKIYVTGTPEAIFSSKDPVVENFVKGISMPREHMTL